MTEHKESPPILEKRLDTETHLSLSLRLLIHIASLRLLLERVASKAQSRLAYCLLLHIDNFTTLTTMADKPFFFLPPIIFHLLPELEAGWSKAKRKKFNKYQGLMKIIVERIKIYMLWVAITFVFHHHSSPFALVRLNWLIAITYESGKVFWLHMFFFKVLPVTSLGARFSLGFFFNVQRYFHHISRQLRTRTGLWFFQVLDWTWPRRHALCCSLRRTIFKICEYYVYCFLFIHAAKCLYMLVQGALLFEAPYWTGLTCLQIFLIAVTLITRYIASDWKYFRRRREVSTPGPLDPFEYAPFQEQHTIRLLLVYPRHPEGPVKCRIFQKPPSSILRYEAISYRWGGEGPNKEIVVNGCSVMVTPNAFEAIKNRSSFWKPKLLWIDSVCIDQSEKDDVAKMEKAQQIEHMDETYRNAYIVSATLMIDAELIDCKTEIHRLMGDGAVHIWSSMDMSQDLAEFRNELLKNFLVPLVADLLNDLRLSFFYNQWNHLPWEQKSSPRRYSWRVKAFRQLLANPWFERMWVVQEVALPPSLRVIYGELEINWNELVDAVTVIGENQMLCALLESGARPGGRVAPPIACLTIKLMNLIRTSVQNNQDRTLGEMLLYCRQFTTQDPEDKLFAIRGMCSKLPKGLLKPTESLDNTWEEVYINAAECLVSEGDAAKVLASSGGIFEKDATTNTALPSWVPNWTNKQLGTPLSVSNKKLDYNSGGNHRDNHPIRARVEKRSLFLAGMKFDDIVELGPVWDVSPLLAGQWKTSDFAATVPALFKASYDLVIGSPWTKEPYSGVEGQVLREAFWRTMIGNRTLKKTPAPPSLVKRFEDYEKWFTDILKDPENPNTKIGYEEKPQEEWIAMADYSNPLTRCWGGRRICITRKGYIGIVPPCSNIEDHIVVFPGMETPFVFRTVKESGSGSVKYRNVGECYVHGLMNGEIFRTGIPEAEFELI